MTPLGKVQYLEITFLEGYLLHTQGDRMLMGHSIEGRFPFLDYRVAEFAASLPGPASAAGPVGEVPAPEGGRAPAAGGDRARKKRPYRAPIVGAFVGPDAPPYVRELLDERSLDEPGCSPRRRSRASCASARPARRATR